jgi:carboxymethylenebutenolidase
MPEIKCDITAADGNAEAFIYVPEVQGSWPALLFLTDIWGIRAANQLMAQRLMAQGYTVLMPNIFYRSDKLPILDFEPQIGEARTMRRLSHLLAAVSADQMARDGVAYTEYLLAQPQTSGRKIAVLGYCFTGQFALRTAAAAPDLVAAAASFHGGHLVTDKPDSPHSVLPLVRAELYFGHAVEDQSMTPAAIETLDLALKSWGGQFQSEIYAGSHHGWCVPDRPSFNPAQAERHYEKLLDLLKRTVG